MFTFTLFFQMAAYRPPVPEHALVNAAEFAMYEKVRAGIVLGIVLSSSCIIFLFFSIASEQLQYWQFLFADCSVFKGQ